MARSRLAFVSCPPLLSPRSLHRTTHRRAAATTMTHKLSAQDDIEFLKTPIAVRGIVQRGFGRGSRDLGTPTANLPGTLMDGVEQAERDGVYLGWGCVPSLGGQVVKMVANLGRNITYDDVPARVLEAYLMKQYERDFYGEEMRLVIIGFMRPELKFDSIDELITHIGNDVAVADAALDLPKAAGFRNHDSLVV